jgi:membrane protein
VGAVAGLWARLQRSHAWRTWQLYGSRRGPVLAGGIAYAGLFSVFGAVVAGFSVFGLVLGANGPLFDAVVSAVDDTLPGLLDVPAGDGVIEPASLVDPNLVSWTGAIAFLTAVFAGLGWLDALREGVRAMFAMPPVEQNVVRAKLVDVLVLATLGLAVLTSAVLSIGTGSAASWLLQQVGMEGGPVGTVALRLVAFAVVATADALILLVVFRLLAGLHLPWIRMRGAAIGGGVALAAITHLSGLLIGSAGSRNALLATGAVLVGLLIVLNLVSRVILVAACWMVVYDDPDAVLEHGPPEPVDLVKSDAYLRAADPRKRTFGPGPEPTVSQRAADRTSVAAGVVLGATAVVVARVLGRATTSAFGLLRRRDRDDD